MNNEAKHTNGEWNVSKSINDYSIYTDGSPRDIAEVFQYSRGIDPDEAKANANLIAAAPELLDASQSVLTTLEAMGQDDMIRGMRMALENAIQKATGQ